MECWKETIRANNVRYLEKKVEQLNRRCDKLGIEPLSLSLSDAYILTQKKVNSLGLNPNMTHQLVVDATIIGEEPRMGGWEPIAVFQLENDLVLIRSFPGKSVPIEMRPSGIRCQHCNTNRFRKSSILMRDDSGKYMEVGTSCVKDFIGYSPASWLFWSTISADVDAAMSEHEGGLPSDNNCAYDLMIFLSQTAAVIRECGWISKTKAAESGETATVSIVVDQLRPPSGVRSFDDIHILTEDVRTSEMAVGYFLEELDASSDYVYNAKQVIELGYVPMFNVGLAASIVGTYCNHLARKKESVLSEWVGEPKERLRFHAKYLGSTGFDGAWGWTDIHSFMDSDGNVFKWFTTTDKEMEKDDEVIVTGTVKKHDEYNGKKSTIITRCKIERK